MENHKFINDFINNIDSFPKPSNENISEYNLKELRKILHFKELKEVLNIDDSIINYLDNIDFELGKLLPDILKGSNILDEYILIEEKISRELLGDSYIYAKQSALSIKSLIHYKNNELNEALNITQECIVLNEYLVNKGINTLNTRIYEQIKNISKIYHKQNDDIKAISIISDLLNYLYTGKSNLLIKYSLIIDKIDLWEKTPVLREFYTNDLLLIYLNEFMKFKKELNHKNIKEIDWIKNLDFEVFTEDRKIIYNWIYIHKSYENKQYTDFLDGLDYFFKDSINEYYNILKINLLNLFKEFITSVKISYEIRSNILLNINLYLLENLKITEKEKIFLE